MTIPDHHYSSAIRLPYRKRGGRQHQRQFLTKAPGDSPTNFVSCHHPSCVAAVFTVTGIKRSLAEAKMR